MTLRLLASPASPYTRKVRIVLGEKRIDWRAQYKALAMHDDELMERPAFAETVPRA
jgi:glutathione S-transferase